MTATTDTAPARDEWREQARHLIAQGLSNRAIARHPGMPGKDAVSRLRRELSPAHQPPPAQTPPGAPPPPDNRATTATGARHDAPPAAPPAPDTSATPDPGARHTAPPTAPDPDQLTLPATPLLREHLAVLAEAGLREQDALTLCVGFVATAIRDAWEQGVSPRGELPAMHIRSYAPDHPATRTTASPPTARSAST